MFAESDSSFDASLNAFQFSPEYIIVSPPELTNELCFIRHFNWLIGESKDCRVFRIRTQIFLCPRLILTKLLLSFLTHWLLLRLIATVFR